MLAHQPPLSSLLPLSQSLTLSPRHPVTLSHTRPLTRPVTLLPPLLPHSPPSQGHIYLDPNLPTCDPQLRSHLYRQMAGTLAALHAARPDQIGLKGEGVRRGGSESEGVIDGGEE